MVPSDLEVTPVEFARKLFDAQAQMSFGDLTGRLTKDIHAIDVKPVLRVAAEHGPELLAVEAEKRLHEPSQESRLLTYWSGTYDYLSRAILQPYAATLRTRKTTPDRLHLRGHCPFCGGSPWISFRKSAPDAESGFRFLVCSLCALEWQFNRGKCACCSEEDPHKLPVYRSEQYPNALLETCETCNRYIKTIDLTKDARPVPILDDLNSLSLDLWAVEQGWTRIEPGLAGL